MNVRDVSLEHSYFICNLNGNNCTTHLTLLCIKFRWKAVIAYAIFCRSLSFQSMWHKQNRFMLLQMNETEKGHMRVSLQNQTTNIWSRQKCLTLTYIIITIPLYIRFLAFSYHIDVCVCLFMWKKKCWCCCLQRKLVFNANEHENRSIWSVGARIVHTVVPQKAPNRKINQNNCHLCVVIRYPTQTMIFFACVHSVMSCRIFFGFLAVTRANWRSKRKKE